MLQRPLCAIYGARRCNDDHAEEPAEPGGVIDTIDGPFVPALLAQKLSRIPPRFGFSTDGLLVDFWVPKDG
ncbi:hypothetical protein H4S14_003294 [Agrobacterium vitis]|nr:hypothetical protein [Agrobacterium vitis]MBE1439529.1 hypothetical protein [Agrobacterium vitis]